jgi:enoyl-CoA hydratase
MPPYQRIIIDRKNSIATLTFNRPAKLNAINLEVLGEVEHAFCEFDKDPSIGVIILTGSGEKAFVAGSDIGLLATFDRERGAHYADVGHRILGMIQNFPKPVIAAVNGYALGSGCEIILACHIRIAADTAQFGLPEVGLGLIPGHGGTQRLARIIGIGNATELILTGNIINAKEALRIGLVTKIVPIAELNRAVETTARTILAKSPAAIKIAIRALNANFEKPLGEGIRFETELFKECLATEDFHEGTRAFLEKRKPAFKGK